MVQNKCSWFILDVTYLRRVLRRNRIFGCSYFVRDLNKTWTSSYKWFRVLSKTWTIRAHACHMHDDNNNIVILLTSHWLPSQPQKRQQNRETRGIWWRRKNSSSFAGNWQLRNNWILRDKRRCKLFFVLMQLNWKGFQFATLRMKSTKVVTVN